MPSTLIEKILARHAGVASAAPGDILDIELDARVARDFGGASVVQHLRDRNLGIENPSKTFFTFDCNPGGSDQKYAANQQICRMYAREHGISVFDIQYGIGTHLAIEEGIAGPGSTFVSTDSHANILGAVGAFGQGMGDQEIAAAFANGRIWFRVPATVKIVLQGEPSPQAGPKDIVLRMLSYFGASGLLGAAAEIQGKAADRLDLSGRITMASMATEMAAIIMLFSPDRAILEFFKNLGRSVRFDPVYADPEASYERTVNIDIGGLEPQISRPGRPEDVVPVSTVERTKVDSVFIGSCTNGRFEDMKEAAGILENRKVAPDVVLKIVPATRRVWERCLKQGLIDIFMKAGALIGNPGCAGCAAGQIGQNGPGEVTVSTGNRNFPGKQGRGDVYLASPATAAASAVAGFITVPERIAKKRALSAAKKASLLGDTHSATRESGQALKKKSAVRKEAPSRTQDSGLPLNKKSAPHEGGSSGAQKKTGTDKSRSLRPEKQHIPEAKSTDAGGRPVVLEGRVWVIPMHNIDTDMIFHNRYLHSTKIGEMGQYTFDNLEGWKDFAVRAGAGDIVITGNNFGAGSSRQQAVDCFRSLGIQLIIAGSFGAIYERNAINAGLPILTADLLKTGITSGEKIRVDLDKGVIFRLMNGEIFNTAPFAPIQMEIYQRGGLLGP